VDVWQITEMKVHPAIFMKTKQRVKLSTQHRWTCRARCPVTADRAARLKYEGYSQDVYENKEPDVHDSSLSRV